MHTLLEFVPLDGILIASCEELTQVLLEFVFLFTFLVVARVTAFSLFHVTLLGAFYSLLGRE